VSFRQAVKACLGETPGPHYESLLPRRVPPALLGRNFLLDLVLELPTTPTTPTTPAPSGALEKP
jgi:hypothetical protein